MFNQPIISVPASTNGRCVSVDGDSCIGMAHKEGSCEALGQCFGSNNDADVIFIRQVNYPLDTLEPTV